MSNFIQNIFRGLFRGHEIYNPPEWRDYLYSLDNNSFGNWLDQAFQNANLYPIVVSRTDTSIEDILINSYEMAVGNSVYRSQFKYWIDDILSRWDTNFFPAESYVALVNIIGYTRIADKETLSILNEMAVSQDFKNKDLNYQDKSLHNSLLKTIIGYTLDDSFLTILKRDIVEPEYSAICAEGLWRRGKGEASRYIWYLTKFERHELVPHEIEEVLRDWIFDVGFNTFIKDLQYVIDNKDFSRLPESHDIDRLLIAFINLGYKILEPPPVGGKFVVTISYMDDYNIKHVENLFIGLKPQEFSDIESTTQIAVLSYIQQDLGIMNVSQSVSWSNFESQIVELVELSSNGDLGVNPL